MIRTHNFLKNPFQFLLWPLQIKNIWIVPPLSLLVIYAFPCVYGISYFQTPLAVIFLGILILSCATYFTTYFLIKKVPVFEKIQKFRLDTFVKTDWIIGLACLAYFTVFIIALLTSEKIAIVEAFRGADGDSIALARESLFKSREGIAKSLLYLNTFLSSAFMPYAIAIAYLEKKKYRHILLTLFIFSLAPSLEKTSVIKAFLPLIILGLNRYIPWREALLFTLLMVTYVFGTAKLAKVGHIRASGTLVTMEKDLHQTEDFSTLYTIFENKGFPKPDVHRFELIDTSNPFGFIINRTIWIPYITAYDWLVFSKNYLDGKQLNGRTSRTIAFLTGQQHFNMDQAVFAMEFSGGKISTGSANAVYIIDAFVNLGWLGVIIAAILIAIITRIIALRKDPAISACYLYYLYILTGGSLLGVLFSNGMLLFILMAILLPLPKQQEVQSQIA